MESFAQDQNYRPDSPFTQSYVGSYYRPPDKIISSPNVYLKEAPDPLPEQRVSAQSANLRAHRESREGGSKAVISALKTLQEKMRRLELERIHAETNVEKFSQAARGHERYSVVGETDGTRKTELMNQLQTAEERSSFLQKQLGYLTKMAETLEKTKGPERQASCVQERQQIRRSELHSQLQKLDRLERECLKLTKTQSDAERKIELLEKKLLQEEHERKLVQEKADELQRELETSLLIRAVPAQGPKPKKKRAKSSTRVLVAERRGEAVVKPRTQSRKLPFVAGTSTSPSHSVPANVQSLLHMMKHHKLRPCEGERPLGRTGPGAHREHGRPTPSLGLDTPAMGGLSELLLALQDELGQMSFEHQELVHQIEETQGGLKEDLERELDCLVKKMEEKAAQISKLRKHQHTVQTLTQTTQNPKRRLAGEKDRSQSVVGVRLLPPSPPRRTLTPQGAQQPSARQDHLQLLRDAQRLCTSLKHDDITWET